MRAGLAKIDVTPTRNVDLAGFRMREQPMTGVLDPLFVRTVAFEDEAGQRAVYAEVDNLGVPFEILRALQRRVTERYDLKEADVHVAATHTHSAPCLVALRDGGDPDTDYVEGFMQAVVESVGSALDGLRPTRLALSRGGVDLAKDRRMSYARNRRGPQLDPEALALWLYEEDVDRPFGVIVNYGCHAVVMRDRLVSADWPGATCRALETHFGGDFISVVIPGGGANLNPAECGEPAQLEQMGASLAQAVLECGRDPVEANGVVETRSSAYRLEFRVPVEQELSAYIEGLKAKEDLHPWESTCLKWAVETLDKLQHGQLVEHMDIGLNVLDVGGVRFALLPFETFSKTARAIRAADPGVVFVASCADGILGYLPIDSAYDEGGYEVDEAPRFYDSLAPKRGTAEEIVEVMRSLLRPAGRER